MQTRLVTAFHKALKNLCGILLHFFCINIRPAQSKDFTDSHTNDHVVLADGKGGYVGNSSSQNKVVAGDNYNEMGGLTPTKIIKTGGQAASTESNGESADITAADSSVPDDKGGQMARRIAQNTGLPANLIYAQMYHESANFDSKLAREDHNYGGVKGTDGEYLHFDNDQEFVDYMSNYLPKYKEDGIYDAKNVDEYAAALQHGGYFTANLDEYINGMKGALSSAGLSEEGKSSSPQNSEAQSSAPKVQDYSKFFEDIPDATTTDINAQMQQMIDSNAVSADQRKALLNLANEAVQIPTGKSPEEDIATAALLYTAAQNHDLSTIAKILPQQAANILMPAARTAPGPSYIQPASSQAIQEAQEKAAHTAVMHAGRMKAAELLQNASDPVQAAEIIKALKNNDTVANSSNQPGTPAAEESKIDPLSYRGIYADKTVDHDARYRGGVKNGVIDIWQANFKKADSPMLSVSLNEIGQAANKYGNSTAGIRELIKAKRNIAVERWMEGSPNEKVKEARRDNWENNTLTGKLSAIEDRGIDSAVHVASHLFEQATGEKPTSQFEKHAASKKASVELEALEKPAENGERTDVAPSAGYKGSTHKGEQVSAIHDDEPLSSKSNVAQKKDIVNKDSDSSLSKYHSKVDGIVEQYKSREIGKTDAMGKLKQVIADANTDRWNRDITPEECTEIQSYVSNAFGEISRKKAKKKNRKEAADRTLIIRRK